jgi:glycosyltransferase involved in cell wall biosynthesis
MPPASRPVPSVSVIVPVRDGGAAVGELVATLESQTLARKDFEVMIADDGSTDGATDGVSTEDGWLRVLPGPPVNPYAARNRAVREARGRVLVFCDADCRPERDWLEAGLAALEDADVVAGLIRFAPTRRTIWSLLDMEMFLDQERTVRSGRAVTANLFVWRELFDRLGGFDDSLANGGDQEFVSRCVADGARLAFARAAVVLHPPRETAKALLGKIWTVNRRHGTRVTRAGGRPDGLTLRAWVPFVQVVRSRRRAGRSLLLDRHRLSDSDVEPSPWEDALALPLIYLVLPYLGRTAQILGWRDERRSRRGAQEMAARPSPRPDESR